MEVTKGVFLWYKSPLLATQQLQKTNEGFVFLLLTDKYVNLKNLL